MQTWLGLEFVIGGKKHVLGTLLGELNKKRLRKNIFLLRYGYAVLKTALNMARTSVYSLHKTATTRR
uniref:Uncharacterized protein n=1 Tax=Anguilla anguilla TaxID=7936 RepID=A0A0E9PME6_ANGAN